MKKALSLLLLLALVCTVLLCACSEGKEQSETESKDESGKESSVPAESGENSGEASSEESSGESGEESSEEPIEPKDYPVVSGTFMQPGPFTGYTVDRMKEHLSYMKEVGIDTLILQWSFLTEGNKVKSAVFDSSFPAGTCSDDCDTKNKGFLDVLLSAAEQTGVKVFVGLNDNDEWWQVAVTDRSWIEQQAELGIEGAKQIFEKYAEKYPNALYGWYFVFEFFNMNANETLIDNAAYLLNLYRNGLYALTPDMPMMLSPYIDASGASPKETEKLWSEVFAKTEFREGDIFCCQDSVGAGHISIDQLDGYYQSVKAAVDTKKELAFWANNEDFTASDWTTAPLDRFVRQLQITDPYVEGHVTFAYSHYQNPDLGKTGFHLAYKTYYETGKIPETTLGEPETQHTESSDGSSVTIKGKAANDDKTLMGVKIVKNGELVKFFDYSADYGKAQYEFSYIDHNQVGKGNAEYKVFAVDYYGNEGPAFAFSVSFESRDGTNVAEGKTYSLSLPADASYPDEDGKALTDGKTGQPSYADAAWLGFLGRPEIVIDLGKTEKNIYGFEVCTMGGGGAGIFCPTEIVFSVSDDGKTFTQAGSFTYPADTDTNDLSRVSLNESLAKDVSGRYVKITVGTNQSWIFIDEVRVFAE